VPSVSDILLPGAASVLSAGVALVLGRRSQKDKAQETTYTQAWRLIDELREEVDRWKVEVDRCRARIGELETEVERVKREHRRDRDRWQQERKDLLDQFYGPRRRPDDTPPPGR
jgi:FtsZ-binding cell division protein ZapB